MIVKKNIEKLLNKDCNWIYKNAYGKGFKECLLGIKTVQKHIENLSNLNDFKNMKYILNKEKNVIGAKKLGITAFVFNSIDDIKNAFYNYKMMKKLRYQHFQDAGSNF